MDLSSVNPEQKQAIETTEGPVLIIAGPGTGKTFTLVKRVAYLVAEKGVNAGEIAVMTFTSKAADELITRISDEFTKMQLDININEMYIGTFHSVCLRLLKENSDYSEGRKSPRMLDAFEQNYLVCRNIDYFNKLKGYKEFIEKAGGEWRQAAEICRYANLLTEELCDTQKMLFSADEDMRFLAKLTEKYKELLRENNAMDFSSIQTETYNMLVKNPDLQKKLRDSISYIMVDEYQDTNYIQEQIVFLLAGKKKNICVVGDDDQGLYRFRGATIRNILEFADNKYFAPGECRKINLNTNYRSESGIIDFYSHWMENVEELNLFNWNKYRLPKNIVGSGNNNRLESSVFACNGENIEDRKTALLNMIRGLKENGNITDYNQVAFLFRAVKAGAYGNKSEAEEIAEFLEANSIPVYSPRSKMYFERKETKQIIGCLMFCFHNYSMKILGKDSFDSFSVSARLREYYRSCLLEAKEIMQADDGLKSYLKNTCNKISKLTGESDFGLLDIFYRIIAFEPFKGYLEADITDSVIKTRAARNLSEFARLLSRFCFLHNYHNISDVNQSALTHNLFNVFMKYHYEDGIGEYEDAADYAPSGCISFMTVHQSKGLEFPVVIVGSLGGTPRGEKDILLQTAEMNYFNRKSFEPFGNIKYFDFWRLYYVAFSRAKNMLVLFNAKDNSKYFGNYLNTLPDISQFECKNTVFDAIKKREFKRVYSFTSHISVYEGCPRQYKYYKEYAFPQNAMFQTSVGSLVHATLEDLNKCVLNGGIDKINEDAIKEWFELNYFDMQESTGYRLSPEQQDNALMQVIRYYRNRKDAIDRVWKAEEEINLVLPDFILQGVVDLAEGVNGSIEIIDYKTGEKPDVENYPERVAHYKKQLEIYAWLIEKRYKKNVSRMHLYYTSVEEGNPFVSFEKTVSDIEKIKEEVAGVVKKIEAKDFDCGARNSYACTYCDMKYLCAKKNAEEE